MEIKAPILAVGTSLFILALTLSLASVLRTSEAAASNRSPPCAAGAAAPAVNLTGQAAQGHSLFERSCAHCHGDDARGDEGPNLHSLVMSDARIARRIKEGVKGEMPRFGSKFNDADVAALIAYLRTLKD
jgi:mono/diheme cytochrome c family protein